jgi:hypothetical protein
MHYRQRDSDHAALITFHQNAKRLGIALAGAID